MGEAQSTGAAVDPTSLATSRRTLVLRPGTLRRTDPEHRDRSDTHVSVGGIGVRRGRRRLND